MVRWQRNWIFTHHTVALKLSSAQGNCFLPCLLSPLPFHNVYCNYHVKGKNGKHDEVVFASQEEQIPTDVLVSCDSYHMILNYELELGNHLSEYSGNEVTFKFYHLEVDVWGGEGRSWDPKAFQVEKLWGVSALWWKSSGGQKVQKKIEGEIKEIEREREFYNYCKLIFNYYLVFKIAVNIVLPLKLTFYYSTNS